MTSTSEPVSRRDIEAKLNEIKGGVDDTTSAAKPAVAAIAVVAVVAIVGVAFLLGRRKGRKRSTVVEIRRV